MSTPRARIVVGLDGSQGSERALDWAAREARLHDATLHAVLAWSYEAETGYNEPQPEYPVAELQKDAQRALEANIARARESVPSFDAVAVEGDPADALIAAADGAEMLVVGSRGIDGFEELLLGSVGHACIRHAPCPVVIVRAHASPQTATARVVVGDDGSPGALAAVRWAVAESRLRRAHLDVIRAWRRPRRVPAEANVAAEAFARLRSQAESSVGDALRKARAAATDLDARIAVIEGPAARVLVEASKTSALLVVGSHGHSLLRDVLLGSVSHQCATHAWCPVAVVRGH